MMTISRMCTTAPLRGRNTKICMWVMSPDVIIPVNVWCRSVQEFSIPEGLKIGVFHWHGSSPLQQFCTTAQTVTRPTLSQSNIRLRPPTSARHRAEDDHDDDVAEF